MVRRVRIFYWILLAAVLLNSCVSTNLDLKIHTYYNQKQSGDGNNLHLTLKDFQVIAIVGDDALDSLGEFDYSDLTGKPDLPKPATEQTHPSSPAIPSSAPVEQDQPSILYILTPTTRQPPKENPQEEPVNNTERSDELTSTTNAVDETNAPTTTEDEELNSTISGSLSGNVEKFNSPDKVKVQISEMPLNVVPGEAVGASNEGRSTHGEIFQLRRCASGFARDRKGRCRRVRRAPARASQLPYDFIRLVSNLGNYLSTLRQVSPDTSSSSSSEFTED